MAAPRSCSASAALLGALCCFGCGSGSDAAGPYTFVTLGDWGGVALGGYHSQDVKDVAQQMAATAAESNIRFVVNVGDNFYYCGIQNTSDFQIREDYTAVYTAPSLQVPWYSALGNHEYGYNVDAQVQFTSADPTGRWYLPARYYTKRVKLAAEQHLTFVVLDTSPCVSAYRASSKERWDPCGSEFPTCSPIEEGPCRFHENVLAQDCSAQHAWFKAQLAAVEKGDWLIVVGHHPADEMDVEDFVSPLQARGFDLYLNGHVHILQQYTVDGGGAYVTSGAGAMVRTADQQTDPRCAAAEASGQAAGGHSYQSVWSQKVAGFTLHTFDADFATLRTDFVSYTGEVLHSLTVSKGSGPSPGPSPSPGPPAGCGGAGAYPCTRGCTYVHKANEQACGVERYGCYNCSGLPADCPDCSPMPWGSCGGPGASPCGGGCVAIPEAGRRRCGVEHPGCYDCAQLAPGCPRCQGQALAAFV